MKRLCTVTRENPALVGVALAILAAFAGAGARYWFYEPDTFGAICYAEHPWWCVFRTFIAVASKYSGFSWTALTLAVIAAARAFAGRPAVGLSYGAIVIGGVGLLLYDATLSVPAILIATILLVRAPERRSL